MLNELPRKSKKYLNLSLIFAATNRLFYAHLGLLIKITPRF